MRQKSVQEKKKRRQAKIESLKLKKDTIDER